MKKVLLFATGVFFFAFQKINAQCTVSDFTIEVISFNSFTCQVSFNLSWEQEVNNGNKFAYIHLWKEAQYHTPSGLWKNMYSNPSAMPDAAALVNTLLTISIFDNGTSTPTIHVHFLTVLPTTDLLRLQFFTGCISMMEMEYLNQVQATEAL